MKAKTLSTRFALLDALYLHVDHVPLAKHGDLFTRTAVYLRVDRHNHRCLADLVALFGLN